MKKLIASLTVLAAGAALASSVSSTATFGVLKITSSAEETAISVPWISAGTSGETILVKDFVKTSNLKKDDLLLVYDPNLSAFKCWVLSADGGTWEATGATYNGVPIPAGSVGDTLNRGEALILVRNIVSDTAIYLYGQYKAYDSLSYVITRSTTDGKVVKSLFAPINTSSNPIYLNTQETAGRTYVNWGNGDNAPKVGDVITLQNASGNRFDATYNGTRWTNLAGDEYLKIQPGMGAWYSATNGTANVTAMLTTVAAAE